MKKRFVFWILAMFVLEAVASFGATIKYVTPTGFGDKDGSSWNNALPGESLQDAINTSTGGQVWVAAGTYYPTQDSAKNSSPADERTKTFTLRNKVAVYGGFAGNETSLDQRARSDRDNDTKTSAWEFTNETILNGNIQQDADSSNNVYHVVFQKSYTIEGALLDGFTIREGFAAELVWDVSHTYQRYNERAENSQGGGLFIINADMTRCVVSNNVSYAYGAGLMLINGTADSSYFVDNMYPIQGSYGYGGGALINENGTIKNSLFKKNNAYQGSSIFLNAGGSVESCIITDNPGPYCVGANRGGSFANCNIVGNTGSVSLTSCSVVSCTMARNQPASLYKTAVLNSVILDVIGSSPASCSYSFITTKQKTDTVTNILVPATYDYTKYFIDTVSYKLNGFSPLINAGMPNVGSRNLMSTDMYGNPRINYGRIDIGSNEHYSRIYISPTGTGDSTGHSWNNAMPVDSLQMAASLGAGEIWMSGGEYRIGTSSLPLAALLQIYGGFSETAKESSPAERTRSDLDMNGTVEAWEFTNATVLMPNADLPASPDYILYDKGANVSTLVDGITVQEAKTREVPDPFLPDDKYSVGGGAIQLNAGLIRNCIVRNNDANGNMSYATSCVSLSGEARIDHCLITKNNTSGASGGGMSLSGNSTASYCVISDNICTRETGSTGGGLALSGNSSAKFCTIKNNKTSKGSQGGGVAMSGKSLLAESIVTNNYNNGFSVSGDRQGGGVYFNGGTIRNCVIANNTTEGESTRGGGVFIQESSDCAIINSTIVNNKALGSNAHGDDIGISMKAFIQNTIFGSQPFTRQMNTNNHFTYCATPTAFTGYGVESVFTYGDAANLYSQFVMPTNFRGVATNPQDSIALLSADWRLMSTSGFINKGYFGTSDPMLPTVDADSTARIKHDQIDLGAYEGLIKKSPTVILDKPTENNEITSFTWSSTESGRYLLFIKEGVDGRLSLTDGADYDADAVFGKGTSVNGWTCVYKGDKTTANVTNLLKGSTYKAMVVTVVGVNYFVYNTEIKANVQEFVTKRDQFISFNLPRSVYAGSSIMADVSSNSGLDILLTTPDTAFVTITGTKISIRKCASDSVIVNIIASQQGNSRYEMAKPVQRSFTIFRAPQTINFVSIADKIYGDEMFVPVVKTSSGLTVDFKLSNDSVVQFIGNSLQIIGDGTVTVIASQDGDEVYAKAQTVSQTFTVRKAPQVISFLPIADKLFGDYSIEPIVSSSANLPVTLSSSDPAVAEIIADRIYIKGVGKVSITASQSGNSNYEAAPDSTVTFTVHENAQEIIFGTLPEVTYGSAPFTLDGSASSKLPITYTSDNTAIATVEGNVVTTIGAGSCIITASQMGNAGFSKARDKQQVLTVLKMPQKLDTVTPLPDTITFGEVTEIASQVVSDKGLAVQLYSQNESVAIIVDGHIVIKGAGVTIISARQAGNETTLPAANIDQRLVVLQKIQNMTVASNAEVKYGDPDFGIVINSTSNAQFTLQSQTPNVVQIVNGNVKVVGVGIAKVRLVQDAMSGYKTIDTVISITVLPAKDSVAFAALDNKLIGQKDFTLYAESKSGQTVKFYSSNPSVASIIEDQVTINGAGACTISAFVSDSRNFTGDTTAQQLIVSSLNVLKMPIFATSRDTVIDLNALRFNNDSVIYSFISAKHNIVTVDHSLATVHPTHNAICWTGTDTLLFKAKNYDVAGDSLKFAVKLVYTRHADQLGMVTTDSLTGTYNIIAWQPQFGANTAKWIVSRRSQSLSKWDNIDTVFAAHLSYAVDTQANTRQQAYQYALTTVDSSGCRSERSTVHTTMHLKTGVSLQGMPQLWWTAYEGVDVDAYIIYRKNNLTQQFDSIGSTFLTSFTDQNPNGSANYRVAIRFAHKIVTSSLKSDSGPFSQSLSNLSEAIILATGNVAGESISLSPNPVVDVTALTLPSVPCVITVTDANGRKVLPTVEATGETLIDASALSQGAYTVTVNAGDEVYTLTLVKTNGMK